MNPPHENSPHDEPGLPGVEHEAALVRNALELKALLVADGHGVPGALRLERIEAGISNETYLVRGVIEPCGGSIPAAGTWVFRRPPRDHVLPTAHDMEREFSTLRFLAGQCYAAPKPLSLFSGSSSLGSSYIMSWEAGRTLASARDTARLTPAERARASYEFIGALARLHQLDVTTYPRRSSSTTPFAARQLSVWRRQWEAGDPPPRLTRAFNDVAARLSSWAESRSAGTAAVLVHGDYRLDNTVFGDDFRLRAVLDWELATVGDPWCDLGLLLVYWAEAADDERARIGIAEGATQHPGFPTRHELIEYYASVGTTPPDDLDHYTALGYLKLAAIFQGVHARLRIRPQRGERFTTIADAIPRLLSLAGQACG
ncbi:phosphotransferase family protein [Nonomuraea sp. NPDC048916]|uniref:phosphotransferase family protein n=1 Tax=Nonomuraea sp. NPDC048916 TaxID=3154232 RepID=UPI0033E6C808